MKLKSFNPEFFELLPDGVMILDVKGNILYANKALAEVVKKPRFKIIGRPCYEVIHGENCPPDFCLRSKAYKEQKACCQSMVEPHLGTRLWCYVTPIKEDDKLVGWLHIVRKLEVEDFWLHFVKKTGEIFPGLFYIVDQHFRIVFANEKFKALSNKEVIGDKCYKLLFGKETPCDFCVHEDCFKEKRHFAREIKLQADNRWYLMLSALVTTAKFNPYRIIYLLDIDAQKKAEERFKRLFEDIPVAVAISDPEGRIHMVNQAFRKLYQIPENFDVTHLKAQDFYVRKEDREKFLALLKEKGEVKQYEVEQKSLTGNPFFVEITSKLVEEDGKTYIWNILYDITPLKKIQEALLESEFLFRSLSEESPLGVVLMDEEGKITYFNPKAEKIFGYKKEEIIGRDLHLTLVPEKYHLKYKSSFKEVIKTGKSKLAGKRVELEARRKDGSVFPVEIFFNVLNLPNHRLFLGLVQDISERKKLEEERINLEKHRALELMAGGVAHDFNNLLASLMLNLDLARQFSRDEKVIEILTRSQEAIKEAQRLSQRLLLFARGDIPQPEDVSLKEFLKDIITFLLRGSSIRLHLEIPDDLPPVKMDPAHLSQIIQNLVVNAKEAMPEGGTIFIQAESLDDKVVLIIRDTGPGIPEESLPYIFEPGFTTKETGTGLGLATVKVLVERAGGEIEVNSIPGQGTTFKLVLPKGKARSKKEDIKKETFFPSASKAKILVMDDEEYLRDLLKEALSINGFSVETAKDGPEALEKYRNALSKGSPFNLVILDLTVPGGKGGLWAIEKLKEIDPNVKAILSTGYNKDIDQVLEKYPFTDVLTKPYDLEKLYSTIAKYI
ncbi:PAS domain S-box protein [Thermodesulfatator autotrophicus]|uniref:histidine kinase n=1 Tax=Thermodesulfatator autotrophicus TaxID=1795632 RepID=A0A177E8J3_9BACT|nr:PAS domain S-box protein [Thermodesulfatator autotrophicus]OAG28108.1 hypothetical protein TH606_03485 [Thermodesulfatator autotrophicus]